VCVREPERTKEGGGEVNVRARVCVCIAMQFGGNVTSAGFLLMQLNTCLSCFLLIISLFLMPLCFSPLALLFGEGLRRDSLSVAFIYEVFARTFCS
jgi:hypothetical protein